VKGIAAAAVFVHCRMSLYAADGRGTSSLVVSQGGRPDEAVTGRSGPDRNARAWKPCRNESKGI
jgi:hypothetical protein